MVPEVPSYSAGPLLLHASSGEGARAGILFIERKVRLRKGSLMALVAQPAGSRAGPGTLKTWSSSLLSIHLTDSAPSSRHWLVLSFLVKCIKDIRWDRE